MRLTLTAAVVLIATVPALAPAQDSLSLIGHRVVLKYKRPLRIGGVRVEPKDYRAYTVEKADGHFVWLVSGGVAGWVSREQVMSLDEALQFYTEEIDRNPNHWNAYLYRGFVWDVRHVYDKAIADFSAAIRIYPLWANTYNNRGWTWHRLREYDKAIADYTKAIKLDSKNVLAVVNRGLARQDKGDYYRAIIDYKRAIRLDPKYGRAHTALAWLYATCPDPRFRDGKLALKSAKKACDLSKWKEASKLSVLAAAYAELGDFPKAIQWQERAIARYADPQDKKMGKTRLGVFKDGKPLRVLVEQAHTHHNGHPDEGNPFALFDNSKQAARIFEELEDKIGELPPDPSDHDRHDHDKKIAAAILQAARKHRMTQREVKAIWNAGNREHSPSDAPKHEGASS